MTNIRIAARPVEMELKHLPFGTVVSYGNRVYLVASCNNPLTNGRALVLLSDPFIIYDNGAFNWKYHIVGDIEVFEEENQIDWKARAEKYEGWLRTILNSQHYEIFNVAVSVHKQMEREGLWNKTMEEGCS